MFQEGDILCSKYQLKRRFDKGGFSSVWLARDLKAKRDFALKIYAQEKGLDEDGIEEFREEYNLVVNLTHSNIFKPLTYDIEDNKPFIVMPYCERGSASKLIGNITEDEAWKFAHDVASGLAYLHDKKEIVHQDIKPGNILIDDDGKYMITDFGISTKLRETVRMTKRQALEMKNMNYGCGTPEYMGPERWPDEGYIPPEKPIFGSDIWSLGATLFELLTGKVPYREVGGAMQRKTHTIPDIPSDYSNELKKLVNLCLSEKVWERPSAQQIADNALQQKAPVPVSKKKQSLWWKASIVTSIPVCLGVGYFIWALITTPTPPNNDTVYLEQVEHAARIVKGQSEDSKRIEDEKAFNIYISKINEAQELFNATDTIPYVSDSAKIAGKEIWNNSMIIVASDYHHLDSLRQVYEEIDATGAIEVFTKRSEKIGRFVKDINNNNN